EDGRPEHRLRPRLPRRPGGRAGGARRPLREAHGAGGPRARLSPPALRRDAAAGGDRPQLHPRAGRAPDGRALRRARRPDPHRDAGGADPARPGQPPDRALHHPQRGGGGVPGRPGRGDDPAARPDPPGVRRGRRPAGGGVGAPPDRGGDGAALVHPPADQHLAAAPRPQHPQPEARGGPSVRPARCLWLIVLGVVLGAGPVGGPAAAQTPINVSYQPALYWSVPYYIASERGFWQEAGLKPSFTTFPSGAPQVAAAGSKSWDVGGMGSAPAVLGAARFILLTIGITNDESSGNLIMARDREADAILKDPASLKGKQLLLTTNSTGEYAALACLKKLGLALADMQVVNLGQAEIISAFTAGNGTLAGVWAPNNYTLEQRTGARTICTGKDAGTIIPGT